MSGYVFRTEFPYLAYLRAGAPTVVPVADSELNAKIGTALPAVVIASLAHAAPAATSGTVESKPKTDSAPKPVRRLDASFDWASCEVLTEIGALADPVERMKTEAAEQASELTVCDRVDIARESLQRGNHAQAFHQLQVILADGSAASGVKDFRPHFLMGLIRLGSFANTDSTLVDLEKAETAFAQAARRADGNHVQEAALAAMGAAWACYARGRIDDALLHVRSALSLELELPEAHFLVAKFLVHANRLDEARPALEKAVQLDPQYGLKVACDGDFERHRELLLECLDSVRLHARRRAKIPLELAARQRLALNIEPEDVEGLERDCEQLSIALALADSAAKAFAEDTVWGYHRAAGDAERASDLLAGLVDRLQKLRLTAIDTTDAVEREAAQIAHIEVGGYRLADFASAELAQAADLLKQAQESGKSRRFAALIQAERSALRARAALHGAVERFRGRSLMSAAAEKTDVERALAAPMRSHTRAEEAKTFALGAVLVGICPTGCISGMSAGGAITGAAIVEFCMSVAALAAAGAILGALIAPWYDGENSARRQQLERRRRTLLDSIEQLRAFGVEPAPHASSMQPAAAA